MSYIIATFIVPFLLGLIFILIPKKVLNIKSSKRLFWYSFFLTLYAVLLYILYMNAFWDTDWSFYSVGFIAILSFLTALVLKIIKK
jgi:hypothetical protein